MYVRVHEVDGKWFRDNGTLVGEESNHPFNVGKPSIKIDEREFPIVHGYRDEHDFFYILCSITCRNPYQCIQVKCSSLKNKEIVCPFYHLKDSSYGTYVNLPHYLV